MLTGTARLIWETREHAAAERRLRDLEQRSASDCGAAKHSSAKLLSSRRSCNRTRMSRQR